MLASGTRWADIDVPRKGGGQIVEPDGPLVRQLMERYARFTSLYPNLQDFFRKP